MSNSALDSCVPFPRSPVRNFSSTEREEKGKERRERTGGWSRTLRGQRASKSYGVVFSSFMTLQDYLGRKMSYGDDQYAMWLNIYNGIQYDLNNDVTPDHKRLMYTMGWTPFETVVPMPRMVGSAAGGRGGAEAAASGAGTVVGQLAPKVKQETKGPKATVKSADPKGPGEQLPQSAFLLGATAHQVTGDCLVCITTGHFQTECPHACQLKYG